MRSHPHYTDTTDRPADVVPGKHEIRAGLAGETPTQSTLVAAAS